MKQIKLNKHFSLKVKLILILAFVLVLFGLLFQLIKEINGWYNTHYFQFNPVVQVKFNTPVEIKERKVSIQEVIKVINDSPLPSNLTPIEKYICEKWGPYDCRTALALFKAESGMKEDAYHVNSDLSIDYGIAQINSVNWRLEGCSLKEIVDPRKNVDCAYRLWDRGNGKEGDKVGNFNAWVAFKNGAFIQHYE